MVQGGHSLTYTSPAPKEGLRPHLPTRALNTGGETDTSLPYRGGSGEFWSATQITRRSEFAMPLTTMASEKDDKE